MPTGRHRHICRSAATANHPAVPETTILEAPLRVAPGISAHHSPKDVREQSLSAVPNTTQAAKGTQTASANTEVSSDRPRTPHTKAILPAAPASRHPNGNLLRYSRIRR